MTLWRRRELLLGALTAVASLSATAQAASQDRPPR